MSSDLYTSDIDSDKYGDLFLEMVTCGKLRLVAIGPGNEGGGSFQIPANPDGWKEAENLIGALREWVRHTKEIQGISEEVNKEMAPENLMLTCDLGVDNEIDYVSRKIREALGTQHIGENQSREILEKQFNRDREYMRILYEEILKKKCVDMGIDPESLRVDWGSMKWEDGK